MASISLYPPLLDNYTPAFISSAEGVCRVYFSLSKFTKPIEEIKTIHIAIVKQESGFSVVNRTDNKGTGRYRSTGIIVLNHNKIKKEKVEGQQNLYYVDILAEDIKDGWTQGWKYKIQLRLGTSEYIQSGNENNLANWLEGNANNFSEWSTYSVTKAIGKSIITIPVFEYNSEAINSQQRSNNVSTTYSIHSSTLDFTGTYRNEDESEILYSYRLFLYDSKNNLIEDSDLIYANQYSNSQQFYYMFLTNFNDNEIYKLELVYETLNKYSETLVFNFNTFISYTYKDNIKIMVAEDGGIMNQFTSVEEEQNAGRIAIKLYPNTDEPFFGNVCIRRSDSKTNFSVWEDIKIIPISHHGADDELPLVYDYTVESGVWYKYGIQEIDNSGYRHTLIEKSPIKREFEYSFLLGEKNQQLRLCYDNTLNNFKNVLSEAKVDTIGGQFPFITRNGNMNYKTFSIGGLISFTMDLDNLFTTKNDIYGYKEVVNLYKESNEYDYTYERDFREKVMNFLTDGKPKLYKSPTEGNILIKLMDVSLTPNQSLGRLVASFSATAYEIAKPTMENYLKYNFYTVGKAKENFTYSEYKIGQLYETVLLDGNVDIIKLINNKYNKENILGNSYKISSIQCMKIHFPGKPYLIKNSIGKIVEGFKMVYNNSGNNNSVNNIILTNQRDTYVFDDLIVLSPNDKLILPKSEDSSIKTVDIEIDFIYDFTIEPKKERIVASRTAFRNIGQLYDSLYPLDSVYSKVYYKYFYTYKDEFRELYDLKCLCIEADYVYNEQGEICYPVFKIIDLEDENNKGELHVMNKTSILNLSDLGSIHDIIYIGLKRPDGTIDQNKSINTLIDYVYYILEGKYK